jgi:ribosomal protein L7/L12
MFAVLEFSDYAIIAVIVMLFAGGSAAYASFRPTDAARLARLEQKIDAILRHLNIEYVDPASPEGLSEEVQKLANDPAMKIQAIKLHREQTGLSLKEAKDAVEAYMSRRT